MRWPCPSSGDGALPPACPGSGPRRARARTPALRAAENGVTGRDSGAAGVRASAQPASSVSIHTHGPGAQPGRAPRAGGHFESAAQDGRVGTRTVAPPEHRGPQEPSVRPERRPDRVSAAGRRGRPSGSHDPGRPRRAPVSPLPPPARTLRRGCRRARARWALLAVCGTPAAERGVGGSLPRSAARPDLGRRRHSRGPCGAAAWSSGPGGAVPLLWSLGPLRFRPFILSQECQARG